MSWTREQRNVTIAAYLGWTLDAFDFFLMVFVLKDIAAEFNTKIPAVAFAVTLTLAMRPLGALIFGRLADRFGRRPTLMVNIACYSVLELASGFAPSLGALLVMRALFGIAMGGEWGVGSALTMETVPPHSRGIVSGLLQAGYPSGYLLASVVFGVLYQYIGWRGMFMIGGWCRRCWCSTCARTCPSRPPGSRWKSARGRAWSPRSSRTGSCRSTRWC